MHDVRKLGRRGHTYSEDARNGDGGDSHVGSRGRGTYDCLWDRDVSVRGFLVDMHSRVGQSFRAVKAAS